MKMLQIKQDNERAKFAFEKVNKIKKMYENEEKKENENSSGNSIKNDKEGKDGDKKASKKNKYLIACKNAPSQMKVNGFGMTMAYLFSKEDSKPLYDDIVEWLNMKFYEKTGETVKGENFLKKIVSCNSSKYMQMSKETMSLLIWMKRFAEGMLK